MPINCGECGGFTNIEDVGSGYARHYDECTCIRCEACGDVIGNTIEPNWWNDEQKLSHGNCKCNLCIDGVSHIYCELV